MELIEAIRNRRSVRGFKPDPVPREVLEELLETCRWAPSAQNTQPWDLIILSGQIMEEVKAQLTEKVEAQAEVHTDIPVPDLPEPYIQRAIDHRDRVDNQQFPPGTEKLDEKRAEYWVRGGRLHDAPNGILICIEKALYPKMVFDAGIIAQTICLAALGYGLGTCITLRPVYWPEMLRETLGIPESRLILMAIAIGYPEPDAVIDSVPRHRVPLGDITHWRGF